MTTNTSTDQRTALETLERITEQREQLEHDQYAAVLEARLAGLAWSKIGQALGVTGQAAHLRYHGRTCNRPGCQEH